MSSRWIASAAVVPARCWTCVQPSWRVTPSPPWTSPLAPPLHGGDGWPTWRTRPWTCSLPTMASIPSGPGVSTSKHVMWPCGRTEWLSPWRSPRGAPASQTCLCVNHPCTTNMVQLTVTARLKRESRLATAAVALQSPQQTPLEVAAPGNPVHPRQLTTVVTRRVPTTCTHAQPHPENGLAKQQATC